MKRLLALFLVGAGSIYASALNWQTVLPITVTVTGDQFFSSDQVTQADTLTPLGGGELSIILGTDSFIHAHVASLPFAIYTITLDMPDAIPGTTITWPLGPFIGPSYYLGAATVTDIAIRTHLFPGATFTASFSDAQAVPEPSSFALGGLGLMAIALARRRTH